MREVSTPPTGPRLHPSGPDTRRESTERRILESAHALIDSGVHWNQLGIRQIAERAEISRTAFYDFFSSKSEVLEHLIRGLYEELTQHLRDALDPRAEGRFDLTYLRPGLHAVTLFAARHGNAYRAFLDATRDDEHLAGLWDELLSAYEVLFAASIEGARAAHPAAPQVIASAPLARTLMLMTERCLVVGPLSDDTIDTTVETLAHVWESAILGPGESPHCD